MILPQTYYGTLILMILSLVCLGSWANFYKLAGKWRYEFFYVDFTFGLMLAAVIAAFTIGSIGFDGFSVQDDIIHAGKRQLLWAFMSGAVFNLANMLMMAALSIAGMGVAFPVTMGIGLIMAMLIGMWSGAHMNPALLASGCALILLAIAASAVAYRSVVKTRRAALVADGKKGAARKTTAVKGIVLAAVGGLIMAGMYPLLARATVPDVGLGPYALTLLMALGMFLSTFVYSIFLMNLPVEGAPVELRDYLRARPKMHMLGIVGGIVWYGGMLAKWVAGSASAEAQVNRDLALAFSEGGLVLAAIWGVAVWKDFRQASGAGKLMAALMLLLLAGGVILLSMTVGSARRG